MSKEYKRVQGFHRLPRKHEWFEAKVSRSRPQGGLILFVSIEESFSFTTLRMNSEPIC